MGDTPERNVRALRRKLEADEYDMSEADRQLLLDVDDQIQLLGPSEYGPHRHEFILRRGAIIAKRCGGLADAIADREACEDVVRWINTEQNDSPETNKDYRVALRAIGDLATDGDDLPDSVEWVPGGYPSNYDPAPDPATMLDWAEDIQPMLDAALNSRDRALVALAWDGGPRAGELFDLTPGNLSDHKYGLQLTIEDGKTGQRSPVLIPSVPYVQRWLDDHPGDSNDPLWCKLTTPTAITNNRIRDALKEIAGRAGVAKPVTPTNFRKSSASYLASQGVSQAHLEEHHGWTRGSEAAARYIAVFDDDNTREIARAHGLDVERDERDAIGPLVCPRCDQKTPREQDACVWCGQVLDQAAAERVEEQRQTSIESVREAEDDVADAIAALEAAAGDDVRIRVEGIDE